MRPAHQLTHAVDAGDVEKVRQLLADREDLRSSQSLLNRCLRYARNNVGIVEALVEAGADINAPRTDREPEGAIDEAVKANSIDTARWMVRHGAQMNHTVDGERRCFALTSAVIAGNMEMVKLLVEHGADFNAVWRKDSNALTYAIQYGQAEIEQYLRSKGAKLPSELAADAALGASGQGGQASRTPTLSLDDSILEHIRQHLGEPMPLTLRPLVPGDLPITIHVVPLHDGRSALVTTGVSHRPMTVPPEQVMYQFAELVMFLPPELEVEVGKEVSPVVGDLCARMRQLAEYPHQNETWLGPATIIDFEEPLAVGTRMSCILAVTEDGEFGQLSLEDAGPILFYFLVPLYSEERDLERRTNTEHLLEMLGRHGIDKTVDLKRRNVAHL